MKGLTKISLIIVLAVTMGVVAGCPQDERETPENGEQPAPQQNGEQPPPTEPGQPPAGTPQPPAQPGAAGVTEQNYEAIETGMTIERVAEMLGAPTSAEPQMPAGGDPNFTGLARWQGQQMTIALTFEDGEVTNKERMEAEQAMD